MMHHIPAQFSISLFWLYFLSHLMLTRAIEYSFGYYSVQLSGNLDPSIVISTKHGTVVWETIPSVPFLQVGNATLSRPPILDGNYQVDEMLTAMSDHVTATVQSQSDSGVIFSGTLLKDANNICSYTFELDEVVQSTDVPYIAFNVTSQDCFDSALSTQFQRLLLTYSSSSDEGFYGFGESYSILNMKGRRVPIMVSEQGIGRGDEPITTYLNNQTLGSGGYWFTSYAPKPVYLTNKNVSLIVTDSNPLFIDLEDANRVQIESWNNVFHARIIAGTSWLQLIQGITEYTGRQGKLPSWSQGGAILGLEGGESANVTEIVALLQNNQVPIAGVWLQDWVGLTRISDEGDRPIWNWQVNYDWYPNWHKMVSQWRSRDSIRVLTYLSPFFTNITGVTANFSRNFFEEGYRMGYFVKKADQSPYILTSLSTSFCMLDPTNPNAVQWMKEIIQTYTLNDAQSSGFMCDFGEYLPFDAVLFNGEDPTSYHNKYPQEFSKIVSDAINEVGQSSETLFFSRSAWTQSSSHVPLFWLGEQLVSWDINDGLKSVLLGALSSGLTGHALTHSDIGGFHTIVGNDALPTYARSSELLMRWSEWAAFGSALFRTQIGSLLTSMNAQVYDSSQSMVHFAEFANIFAALSEYRDTLSVEAQQFGYPLIRPMVLHYFYDSNLWNADLAKSQYLFGEDFIITPCLTEGETSVNAYLPAYSGSWTHLWSGVTRVVSGNKGLWVLDIPSSIGFPCVFYKSKSTAGVQLREYVVSQGYTDAYDWDVDDDDHDEHNDDDDELGGFRHLSDGAKAGIILAFFITMACLVVLSYQLYRDKEYTRYYVDGDDDEAKRSLTVSGMISAEYEDNLGENLIQ